MFGVCDRKRERETVRHIFVCVRFVFFVRLCWSGCEDSITLLSLISSSFKAIAGDVKQMRGH